MTVFCCVIVLYYCCRTPRLWRGIGTCSNENTTEFVCVKVAIVGVRNEQFNSVNMHGMHNVRSAPPFCASS